MKTTDHFEFDSVRKLMADLLQTADRCRLERIAQIDRVMTGMRETLKRAEDTVRTCPAEIAKLEAEREALSKLTPEAAAREMLPPPPPAPNRFDCRECGQGVAADEDGCCATCGPLAQQAQPAPPALLDLRTVRMDSEHAKPDTLIADADLYDTGRNPIEHHASVERGEKFTVERVAADHGHGPRVKVLLDGGSGVFIAAIQPAHVVPRVVKHACPRCDEGMREIEYVNRVWFSSDAVRVEPGTRATIVEWFSARTGKTNMDRSFHVEQVRFVRTDVPPPSEWCDGKGVG